MIKTFCDRCKTHIPVVTSMNVWTLPFVQKTKIACGGKGLPKTLWEEEKVIAGTYHLCDKCVEDIASIFAISGLREGN